MELSVRRLFLPGGTQSAGPYELRLPIFLQPLGGALKNRSAVPASPPCFRRRRTGCGTQHPLRLACVSLAAAPTTPRCFRRWRRSSSLQSAPLLFSSTRLCESDICAKENRQCISTPAVFSWARVDYASRAAKNSPQGCFCPFFCDGAAAVRIHPHENSNLLQTENRQRISTLTVFLWARVDYASRASKKAPQGLFSPPDCSAGRCCSNPPA